MKRIKKMKTIAQQLNIKSFPFEIEDSDGNGIYYEKSDGYWFRHEYDSNGNVIYYENSDGTDAFGEKIPKTVELTLDEIASKFGIDVKLLKIKK